MRVEQGYACGNCGRRVPAADSKCICADTSRAFFKPDSPDMLLPELRAYVCPPDEYDGSAMLCIQECEDFEDKDEYVFVTVSEAIFLRDWLNRILP